MNYMDYMDYMNVDNELKRVVFNYDVVVNGTLSVINTEITIKKELQNINIDTLELISIVNKLLLEVNELKAVIEGFKSESRENDDSEDL